MPADEGAPAPEPRRQQVIWRPDQMPPGPGALGPASRDLPPDVSAARLLLSSLLPAQFGLSLACLAVALVVTVSLPLIAALVPAVSRARVAGLPVTLLLLGFGFYPVLFAVGWFYHRQARQLEAKYIDLVAPPNPPPHA
jgi:hypothetical protein